MSGDFEMALDRSLDEVKPPKLVPAGPWLLKGATMKFVDKEYKDEETEEVVQYKQALIGYTPVEALPGVDGSRVEEGGFEDAMIFVKKNVRNASQEYNLKQFIEKHGIDTQGRTWAQIVKAFRGSNIIGNVTEETYEDRETKEPIPVNHIDGFQKVA